MTALNPHHEAGEESESGSPALKRRSVSDVCIRCQDGVWRLAPSRSGCWARGNLLGSIPAVPPFYNSSDGALKLHSYTACKLGGESVTAVHSIEWDR